MNPTTTVTVVEKTDDTIPAAVIIAPPIPLHRKEDNFVTHSCQSPILSMSIARSPFSPSSQVLICRLSSSHCILSCKIPGSSRNRSCIQLKSSGTIIRITRNTTRTILISASTRLTGRRSLCMAKMPFFNKRFCVLLFFVSFPLCSPLTSGLCELLRTF